jgi:prepilin-type N-terminal cleavage/methylation domain-containing protein
MNFTSRSSRHSSGFTLIEILFVFVILGLLAALIMPVFLLVRKSARMTACSSNLRQIGQAVQMYQKDFDGHLPAENSRLQVTYYSNGPKAVDPLARYGTSLNLFHCPEADSNHRIAQIQTDYTVRFVVNPQRKGAIQFEAWRVEPQPSTVIALCQWHLDKPTLQLIEGNKFYAKNGMFQILRADGSVAKVRSEKVESKGFGGNYDPSINAYALFPDETWPLTLTKVDQVD